MDFGRVIGKVVATIKDERFTGIKLLVLEPLNHRFEKAGKPFIAADGVGVGEGEIVYYETSREAPFAFPESNPAVDASIVGIVDHVG